MRKGEYLLDTALRSTGSTWIRENDLVKYLNAKGSSLSDIQCELRNKTIVTYNGMYSTAHLAKCENDVAINVMRLLFVKPCKKIPEDIIRKLISEFEQKKNEGRKLHYHQVDAVIMVVNYNFSVLTGGPGTGKTTVLSAITYVLRRLNEMVSIVFAAPTGKAARRISESTGETAGTLHQKLGIGFETNKEADPLFEDVIFVDESSMNDIELSATLFRAIKDGKKAVYIGDVDQLPSVGPGAVLRDLIKSGVVPVTMLTHTFRQDNGSTLYANILKVREGDSNLIEGPDFHLFKLSGNNISQACVYQICRSYEESVTKYGREGVVVLVPYRKSKTCSNSLNNTIQKMVNQQKQAYRYTNNADNLTLFFKKNDFVMQLENRVECANGDVGQIVDVSSKGVTVEYVDTTVAYSPEELEQLALAYAMTIHKSQGSEYPQVIMCLLEEHKNMLNRNLVYTGITRAKKECTLIYQESALRKALKVKADENRLTLLSEKLKDIRMQYKYAYGI